MNILQFINQNLNYDLTSTEDLPFSVKEKSLSVGKILTDYGQLETKIYFLKKGLIQISINHNDQERILDFVFEGNFFASLTSMLIKKPSDVQIIAITDIQIEVFDYSELEKAYTHSLLANQLGRFALEKIYIQNTNREKDLLLKTAEQRYLDLLQKRPDIISLLPIHKIAKYLGIHPESLSRIRKSIIS
jgi:CRP-like cAMP-binding protein